MSLDQHEYQTHLEHDQQMAAKQFIPLQKWFYSMQGKNVLDVGCGAGEISKQLVGKFNVIGLDEQTQALKIAEKNGLKTHKGSLEEKLPFPNATFDNVICKDVFEHLVHPHHLLEEIHRVLKENGKLYAHVPNQFTFPDRIRLLMGGNLVMQRWFPQTNEWNFPHLRFFTPKGFQSFLENGKFEILENHSSIWNYHFPLGINTQLLSRISPNLFSPGITLTCRKK